VTATSSLLHVQLIAVDLAGSVTGGQGGGEEGTQVGPGGGGASAVLYTGSVGQAGALLPF
jgi:hypothetical protein